MTMVMSETDTDTSKADELPEGSYPAIEDLEERVRADEEAAVTFTLEGLTHAICKQPLNRPIYRRILMFFDEEHSTEEAEAFIAEIPEFTYTIQPEGRFLDVLERYGGIERVVVEDEEAEGAEPAEAIDDTQDDAAEDVEAGDAADAAAEEAVAEDEAPVDELASLVGARWIVTDLGRQYVEATDPMAPLKQLITQDADRTETYLMVLGLCAEAPQPLAEIERAVRALQNENKSAAQIQPSIYLDRLERVGGLYWKGQWNITEEGRKILADLTA